MTFTTRADLDAAIARILARALVNAVRDEEKGDAAVLRPRDEGLDKNASDDARTPPLAA
jgi:hypothetical protein